MTLLSVPAYLSRGCSAWDSHLINVSSSQEQNPLYSMSVLAVCSVQIYGCVVFFNNIIQT